MVHLRGKRFALPAVRAAVITGGVALAAAGYSFNPAAGDFEKPVANSVRVMTWNVHNNFIYTAGKDGNYSRVIKAASPDVIAFQEMDVSLTETQVKNRLQSYFPGTTWYVHFGKADGSGDGVSNRNAIASRYPLSMERQDTAPTSALRGVTCALVDLPNGTYDKDLYVMSIHFKAGNAIEEHESRQKHADAVTNWIRDARTAGGIINLPTGTPILTVGDFNFVEAGDKAPYYPRTTMLDGTIYNTGTYGASSAPDWDGSENSDASPYDHTNADPATHSSNSPAGRIDRFYYTDSVLHTEAKFIINTQTMSAAARTAAGVNENDTSGASDHLPCVVDFALGAAAPGKLLVNEYLANDVGADDRTFIELINTSGEEINLDGPDDYWIKTSLPLPTTPPSSTNEEFAYDLKGVVPPNGGLFVLYDGAGETATFKTTIESNLGKLNRQNNADFMLRNQDYSAFSLVKRERKPNSNVETNVETYGYGAPNPNTTRYFKLDSNSNTITVGPARWTDFNAGEVGNDNSLSRNLRYKNSSNYAVWTVNTTPTPGAANAVSHQVIDNSSGGFSASANWTVGTSAVDKYGSDYRFHLTQTTPPDNATWTITAPVNGNYIIQAWWSQGANRSITAPFILPGGTTVNKNQQTGGGAWQTLGTVNLTAGTHTVSLSCNTANGTVVIADGIRVLPE